MLSERRSLLIGDGTLVIDLWLIYGHTSIIDVRWCETWIAVIVGTCLRPCWGLLHNNVWYWGRDMDLVGWTLNPKPLYCGEDYTWTASDVFLSYLDELLRICVSRMFMRSKFSNVHVVSTRLYCWSLLMEKERTPQEVIIIRVQIILECQSFSYASEFRPRETSWFGFFVVERFWLIPVEVCRLR